MDWSSIIIAVIAVIGGEFVFKLIDRLVFRKQERDLKKNAVKSSKEDVEEKQIRNDDAQIDLGNKYMQSALEMTQKMQEMMLSSDKERDAYWVKQQNGMEVLQIAVKNLQADLDNVTKNVSDLTEEVREIGAYLNGDYKQFKQEHKLKEKSRYGKDQQKNKKS